MCMNGTALYEGVTVLFLAQVFGVSLDLGTQIIVLILSVITAVGAAGVPGGSLPLLMVVLATVGVPAEGIAIILGVDRILDMCRTTVNVCGDLTAAVYVARTESDWDPRTVGGDVRLAPGAYQRALRHYTMRTASCSAPSGVSTLVLTGRARFDCAASLVRKASASGEWATSSPPVIATGTGPVPG